MHYSEGYRIIIYIGSLSKKEWDIDWLTKKENLILEEIKIRLTHLFHWLKIFFKSALNLWLLYLIN